MEELAADFKARVQADGQPKIEDYLDLFQKDWSQEETVALELFQEIISDEINFRRRNKGERLGLTLCLQDYLVRFPLPRQQAQLKIAFADLALEKDDRLKNFVLEAPLGKGGMGEVWRAKDLNVSDARRTVALKVVRQSFEEDNPIAQERFRAEIAAIATLQHAHVVPMYGADEAEGRMFYTMEYVAGSLAQRIQELQPTVDFKAQSTTRPVTAKANQTGTQEIRLFQEDAAARLILQAARGVHYAHTQAILHRDIKPDNLLIRSGGKQLEEILLVADFGLAKFMPAAPAGTDDAQGHFRSNVGTPFYAAPEQRNGMASVQSDVYGLGATLVAMLVGSPPQQPAESRDAEIRQLVQRHSLAVHKDLNAICLKCLQREPSLRYSSAYDLAEALERFLKRKQRRLLAVLKGSIAALIVLTLTISAAAALVFKHNSDVITKTNEDLKTSNVNSEIRRVAAEERRKLIQTHLYSADLSGFTKAWEAGRFDQVYSILHATRPEKTGDELRGWEWFHLYDLAFSERVRFESHPAEMTACAFSPNEELMASGDKEGNILVWDRRSGAIKQRFEPFSDSVVKLVFSPSGKSLAAGSADSTAVVIDMATGKTAHTFNEHVLGVHALAYGPTDDLLATGAADGTIKISQAGEGAWKTNTLQGHTAAVRNIWLDKSGQKLASVSDDRTLRFWVLRDGKWQADRVVQGVPSITAVSPDLKRFAVWLEKQAVVAVVDAESSKLLVKLPGYKHLVREISFGYDGTLVATADEEGDAKVWEIPTTLLTAHRDVPAIRLVAHYRGAATSVVSSPANDFIASICSDKAIKVWPIKEPAANHFQGHQFDVNAVAFSPDGNMIASGDMLGDVRIWDRKSGALVHSLGKRLRLDGPRGTPASAAKLAGIRDYDPKRLSAIRLTGEGESWIWVFDGHSGQIDGVAFSPDGKILASADSGGKLWLWDVVSGKEVAVLKHSQVISSVAFSADGQWLLTGCWDDQVHVWDVSKRKEHLAMQGHEDNVNAVAVQVSGKYVASGGIDRIARLWELQTGKLVHEFVGHEGEIEALAFSPDGKLLATGASDQTIRIWDVSKQELRNELRGHTRGVTRLFFHPTQNRLFSSSRDPEDAQVRIWDLTIGREIIALAAPDIDIVDMAIDRRGERMALTAGRDIVVWEATEKGRAAPASRAAVEPKSATRQVDETIPPAKVLGYLRRPELMRAIGNTKDPIRPSAEGHELLVLVVSVPNRLLYPTDKEYEILQARALTSNKNPPGPRKSMLSYDPTRFRLRRPEGEVTTAFAIAPLPFAFDGGGFKQGDMRMTSTNTHPPHEREMICVVWDLLKGVPGKLELQFDSWKAVPVPSVELDNFGWHPPKLNIQPTQQLVELLGTEPSR